MVVFRHSEPSHLCKGPYAFCLYCSCFFNYVFKLPFFELCNLPNCFFSTTKKIKPTWPSRHSKITKHRSKVGTTAAQFANPQGVLGNQAATLLMTDGSMALTFFPTFVVDFDGKLVGLNIPVAMDPIFWCFLGTSHWHRRNHNCWMYEVFIQLKYGMMTVDGRNPARPVNSGIDYQPAGAGLLPTVWNDFYPR